MQVKLHELSKAFGGKTAVDIHDFTINNGDIMGLVGNNGAGKTTLFRLMLDLLKADSGTVTMVTADGQCTIDPTVSEDWKQMSGAYIDEGFLIDFHRKNILTLRQKSTTFPLLTGRTLTTAFCRLSSHLPMAKYSIRRSLSEISVQETSRK